MIQQILAIAGLDNMDEFHKKYPTKEKFLKAYPEASRLFEKHEKENFNPVAAYGGSMDHLDQMQYAKGGSVPENSKLWSQAKALAKSKFDVYPSKYANNWAAKWYKQKGGTWRKAAYGGMMYADGGQIGGRVDQLGHYNPSMDLRGGQSTVKQGHYQIGGVTAAGSGTHGQQYSIQHGVATPMPSKAYGGYYQTGGTTYQPQGSTTNGQQYTIQNGVATPVPSRAYGGYYQNGGATTYQPQGSQTNGQQYTIQNGVATPVKAYGGYYQDGGEANPVEEVGMQGNREDAKLIAAKQLLELIKTYSDLTGSDFDTEVENLQDITDDEDKKKHIMKMVAVIKQAGEQGSQQPEDYSNDNVTYADGGKLPREVLRSRLESHMSPSEADDYLNNYKKGGIHIKPSHRGRFTEYKRRTGKTTEEALHSKDPHVRQMANFARNAAKWKHQEGGETMPQEQMEGAPQQMQEQAMGQEQQQGGQDQMMQQLIQMVMQALQQGMAPEQIVQMLVQQGVPQEVAMQVIQMVMQQMQGGAPQGGPGEQYQPQGEQYQGPQAQQPQAAHGGFFNESYMPFDY